MNRHRMIEESCNRYREEAAQLQRRLSERRQECVSLGKDLFRARESARLAHEVADNVERQLEDIGTAYDILCKSHIIQAARIKELEQQSLWAFLQDWMTRQIMRTATTQAAYYGLPR